MDYARPIEAIIPGVHGRVLGLLSRTELELTIRTVARLADVSPQQASVVINELVRLGVARRREAGSSALVSLERENTAAQTILAFAELYQRTLDRLATCARSISPAPASLTLFGSFARGEATAESDLDVLAVCPSAVDENDDIWVDALGAWESAARRIVGNPVSTIVVGLDDVAALLGGRTGPWRAIAKEGIVLVGMPVTSLVEKA